MTQQLAQLADGKVSVKGNLVLIITAVKTNEYFRSKVVLSLEGGYDLPAICDCSEECVRALLDGNSSPVSEEELRRHPCQNAVDTLQKTIAIQVISVDYF